MTPKIEDLLDYPALQQLARALWREDPSRRGAGVLVGAGFSRNAELAAGDAPRAPLWKQLAADMAAELYPRAPDNAPADALRLAEEYRTYFGQTRLDEFIRTHIRDDAWRPGELHSKLLTLPWSDVLTTNYDTLLERAARQVTRYAYEPVRSGADMAHARAPRIVKLHGSIGSSDHFIIAEEDYRTYPTRYAAFVNLARQVFIENELCLVGFSGDDPNFLQWAGWVRDELGGSARRIYLVGALGLGPAKRKLLEARNVAPVDLAPLVVGIEDGDERQSVATRLFLEFLAHAEPIPPHEWRPAEQEAYPFLNLSIEDTERTRADPAYAASLLDQAAEVWRVDREGYPSWLVCPADRRSRLRLMTDMAPWPSGATLAALTDKRRAEVLYELAWRHDVAFWPLNAHLRDLLATVADPALACGLGRRRQLDIALLLLKAARASGDDASFERWASVIEAYAEAAGPELRAECGYQRCLRARDRMDFPAIVASEGALEVGQDPVWLLRRASLRAECGDFNEAEKFISEALRDLRERQRDDRNSLWIKSRRACAELLKQAVRTRKREEGPGAHQQDDGAEFRRTRCDPEQELDDVGRKAADALRKSREKNVQVVPSFEPGRYSDPSKVLRFVSHTQVEPAFTLDKLAEVMGIPQRLNYFSLLAGAKDAAELAFEPTTSWHLRLIRAAHNYSDPLIGRYFARVAVAQMPPEVAGVLVDRMVGAIAFWRDRIRRDRGDGSASTFLIERLRLCIEVLSRLAPRQDVNAARASFDLAMELGGDPELRHPWLFEQIGRLAKHSVEAVPPAERACLVLPSLLFPLSSEKKVGRGFDWPDPLQWLTSMRPERPDDDREWKERISQLIAAAGAEHPGRSEAAGRLTYLAAAGALRQDEREPFGRALWAQLDDGDPALPAGTNLLPHLFTLAPAPDGVDAGSAIVARLFAPGRVESSGDPLFQIYAAALARIGDRVLPTPERAVSLFDGLTAWRASSPGPDSFVDHFLKSSNDAMRRSVGLVVAHAAAPSLPLAERTDARVRALFALIDEAGVGLALAALPHMTAGNLDDGTRQEILRRLQRGIVARDADEIAGAALAIETWTRLSGEQRAPTLPEQLVSRVVSAVETHRAPGLTSILGCARALVQAEVVSGADEARLAVALGDLFAEKAYERIDPQSREAVSVSLERAECVRLAHVLRGRGAQDVDTATWLEVATSDPLPEVRFSLDDPILGR